MTTELSAFHRTLVRIFAVLLACATVTQVVAQQEISKAPARAPVVWRDVQGRPLPFQSDEEIMEFLRTAKVLSMKAIGVGVAGVRKTLLEKDGIQVNAAFRDLKIEKQRYDTPSGTELGFRDDCIFECAAYELGRLLGLDNIPPTVERKIRGIKGTLQIFIENSMMERERKRDKIEPIDKVWWNYQNYVMRVFDNLIFNTDRNQTNIMIDGDWKLWDDRSQPSVSPSQ